MDRCFENEWGLILGSSSGFGLATSKQLASLGMNIFGVHFDRRSAMKQIDQEIKNIKAHNVEVQFFNINAADEDKRKEVVQTIVEKTGQTKPLKVLMHSLAFGTLRDYFAEDIEHELHHRQMDMTIHIMANSLVYWVQELRREKLIGNGSRIFAMTSSGGGCSWPHYGAVSAAKASLESHIRQISLELSKEGVRANSICAGVTDTPALRKIPGHESLIDMALKHNPSGRLTTPEDVAQAISLLARPEANWITGNVIRVDGGEGHVG